MMAKGNGLMVGPPRPSDEQERKWRAESALETLHRAEEIRKDAQVMADVKKLAAEKIKTLSTIGGTDMAKPGTKKSKLSTSTPAPKGEARGDTTRNPRNLAASQSSEVGGKRGTVSRTRNG
jgi:hypothetical protein